MRMQTARERGKSGRERPVVIYGKILFHKGLCRMVVEKSSTVQARMLRLLEYQMIDLVKLPGQNIGYVLL
jgi:hypothetical protein